MKEETQILIYKGEDGNSEFRVKLVGSTIWLSQKQMSELFDKDSDTIGLHLKNIYKSGELEQNSTTEYFSVVRQEGKREVKRKIQFYNLDAIISVGYRVNSIKGTQFRIWATRVLKEHIEKGYSINQTRLNTLKQSVKLIDAATNSDELSTNETKQIIRVLTDYALVFDKTNVASLFQPFDSDSRAKNWALSYSPPTHSGTTPCIGLSLVDTQSD